MNDARHRDENDGPDDSHGAERAGHAHLDDVEDGCGCAEVWEHLSDQREAGAD